MSPFLFGCLFFVLVCLGTAARAASAERPWIEIRSPHFRVLTNAGDADGRKVANQFEQMHHVFAVLFNTENVDAAAPLTIFVALDEKTFQDLEPGELKATHDKVAGNFIGGWENRYAVVRLDTWSSAHEVLIDHEYSHSVLGRTSAGYLSGCPKGWRSFTAIRALKRTAS